MATKTWTMRRKVAGTVAAGVFAASALVVGHHRAELQVSPDAATRELVASTQERTLAEGAPGAPGAEGTTSQAGWDIPNLDHARVDYWIGRFQTDRRSDFETYLNRMGRYAALISTELASRDMPQDLVYLAMIESGFNPKAYSSAKASGLWQFIGATAARYGLDINRAVDERNDPVKATTAALDYLADLHQRFGSWYLAAAAYNMGENGLSRILRATLGRATGTDADYYAVWNRLPKETRDYVPLMVAAARIAKDPAEYGFTDIQPLAPDAFSEIVAKPATPLKTLAKNAGTTVKAIKALNPQLKLDRTRNDQSMVVRVPSAEAGIGAAD
jgi:membrane-bound lytic murein transglycosylase D